MRSSAERRCAHLMICVLSATLIACDADPVDIDAHSTETIRTLSTGLQYPTGLAVNAGGVFFLEAAGHLTSYGGALRLIRYDLASSQSRTLIEAPLNYKALAANPAGQIFLVGFRRSIPGSEGAVSRAELRQGSWTETHVANVAMAGSDIFIDSNGDLYVVGSRDDPGAPSLYRLPSGNYSSPQVIATGLGRATALTKVGSDIYYSRVAYESGIYRLREGPDEVIVPSVNVSSLTSDGTYLYYSLWAEGTINRIPLRGGSPEVVASGLRMPLTIHYDAPTKRLYFLEAGTEEAKYRDGALKVITQLPAGP